MDQIFKSNPNLKEYFRTADGIAFFTDNAARNHARSLENKTITTVKNNKQEKGAPETSKTEESAIDKGEGAPVVNAGDEKGTNNSSNEGAADAKATAANPQSAIEQSAIDPPAPQEQEKPKRASKTPKAQ
jgi:hypothetical protein